MLSARPGAEVEAAQLATVGESKIAASSAAADYSLLVDIESDPIERLFSGR